MKSVFNPSHRDGISKTDLRSEIAQALTECRDRTLKKLSHNVSILTQQSHPDFSPIGWHLGHIAFTEAFWILEQYAGLTPLYPEYHKLFAADGLPKVERQNLPSLEEIKDYLLTVRSKTLNYLATAPIETQERLWWWLIQHESQHGETIALVKKLHHINQQPKSSAQSHKNHLSHFIQSTMVTIPSGEFTMGSNSIKAQDNERPAHQVFLDSYQIDTYPVTWEQYQQFIVAEGYQNPHYWSKQGWQWRQRNSITQPLYKRDTSQSPNHPVYGVSYYEAEAYAKFRGKRLPTEAEWEKAAQFANQLDLIGNHNNSLGQTTPVNAYPEHQTKWGCYDMLGNVWEWTNSWFAPYPGFTSYPYKGYSAAYFDNHHKVLKGGSYVTRPYALRSSFRNWYHPWVREIFAGFRCAK